LVSCSERDVKPEEWMAPPSRSRRPADNGGVDAAEGETVLEEAGEPANAKFADMIEAEAIVADRFSHPLT